MGGSQVGKRKRIGREAGAGFLAPETAEKRDEQQKRKNSRALAAYGRGVVTIRIPASA